MTDRRIAGDARSAPGDRRWASLLSTPFAPLAERRVASLLSLVLLGVAACHRGTAPAPAAPVSSGSVVSTQPSDTLDGRRWLLRDADVATARGAGPLVVAATDVGADGDRIGAFVTIAADQCVVAYARGSFGIDDLDLYAYGDDGAVLAADEAADAHPAIGICPPHPSRAYVAARVVAGRGVVALGVHFMPVAAMTAVSQALGVHTKSDRPPPVDTWPGLSETIVQHRRDLGGAWNELRRVAVALDARAPTRISVPLDGGKCLDTFVVPAEEIAQLDVIVRDDRDATIGRAVPVGRNRGTVVCSPVKTTLAIELRPHVGDGLAAVIFAESTIDLGTEIPSAYRAHETAPILELGAARASRAGQLKVRGYPAAKVVSSGTAAIGKWTSVSLPLGAGCTRLDLVAGKPLAGLSANVYDESGDFVVEGESGVGPTLFACGRARRVRVEVEATSRPGPFTLESRRQAGPAVLADRPVAAGRLLGALERDSEAVSASAGAEAKLMRLDPMHLASFEIAVAGGACLTLAAALDKGGVGIDLRVLDAQSGEERAEAHGRAATTLRLCAPTAEPASLRVELRTSGGPTDALVATHIAP